MNSVYTCKCLNEAGLSVAELGKNAGLKEMCRIDDNVLTVKHLGVAGMWSESLATDEPES